MQSVLVVCLDIVRWFFPIVIFVLSYLQNYDEIDCERQIFLEVSTDDILSPEGRKVSTRECSMLAYIAEINAHK